MGKEGWATQRIHRARPAQRSEILFLTSVVEFSAEDTESQNGQVYLLGPICPQLERLITEVIKVRRDRQLSRQEASCWGEDRSLRSDALGSSDPRSIELMKSTAQANKSLRYPLMKMSSEIVINQEAMGTFQLSFTEMPMVSHVGSVDKKQGNNA